MLEPTINQIVYASQAMELSMIYQAPRAHFVLRRRLHKGTKTSRAHLVAGARCHLREYNPKAVSATHKKDCTKYHFFSSFYQKNVSNTQITTHLT